MASITEAASGFPSSIGHVPFECATLAEVLGERGWNTYMTGKWHLTAEDEMNLASRKAQWPIGRGFERCYRELVFDRQKQLGILPDGAELSPINPYIDETSADGAKDWPELDTVRPWESLSDDEKTLFSRMAEVYAGFLSHADHELGRLLDHLDETGEPDDTIIVLVSDNGASGEGGPSGSVNENKLFNGLPDKIEENLTYRDELGGPRTYNHYPTGWACAFNTPFKLWKRYSNWEGGTADPMIPLDNRGVVEILTTERPQLSKPRNRYTYYPGGAEVSESVAPNLRNRSYTIAVEVTIDSEEAGGVLFAHGSRFGGHAPYIKDGRLKYVYNWVGMVEQVIESTEPAPTGHVVLSASFEREGEGMPAEGPLTLHMRERAVGDGRIKTQPGKFSIAGEGLNIGRDGAEPVTDDYPGDAPWAFVGGTIHKCVIDVSGEPFVDLANDAAMAFARD
jgi:hypothetical protein